MFLVGLLIAAAASQRVLWETVVADGQTGSTALAGLLASLALLPCVLVVLKW
jgi:hypothetical protein